MPRLIIEKIEILENVDLEKVKLQAGEYHINLMLSDIENFDIRVGDTVEFDEEGKCLGVDLSARPKKAKAFKVE